MSLRTRAIREAIIATLARINGTGSYTTSLLADSSQPRIWSGVYDTPPAAPKTGRPIVAIRCLGVDSEAGPSMREWLHRGTWALDCWTAGDPKKPVDRLETAEDLLEDIREALHSNISLVHTSTALSGFSTRNLVDRLTVEATPFTEQLAHQSRDGQAYGRVLVGISCEWRTPLPTQVAAP